MSAAFVRQVKHRVTKLIAAVVETYGDRCTQWKKRRHDNSHVI